MVFGDDNKCFVLGVRSTVLQRYKTLNNNIPTFQLHLGEQTGKLEPYGPYDRKYCCAQTQQKQQSQPSLNTMIVP